MAKIADMYTVEEIITKYKAINETLDSAISRSELDTTQSRHEWQMNIAKLTEQRDYWGKMYMQKTGDSGGIVQIIGK